jgi:hypothetical protein
MVSSQFAAALSLGRAAFVFTLFAAPLGAATLQPSSPSETDQHTAERIQKASRKFVDQTLQSWQSRLNLKDWNIHVELLHPDQLEPKTLGNVHWDTDAKQATIGVLSPDDYKLPFREMLNDMEFTIVHELVHIELASLPRSDASRRIEEHAVNQLAAALIKLANASASQKPTSSGY